MTSLWNGLTNKFAWGYWRKVEWSISIYASLEFWKVLNRVQCNDGFCEKNKDHPLLPLHTRKSTFKYIYNTMCFGKHQTLFLRSSTSMFIQFTRIVYINYNYNYTYLQTFLTFYARIDIKITFTHACLKQ